MTGTSRDFAATGFSCGNAHPANTSIGRGGPVPKRALERLMIVVNTNLLRYRMRTGNGPEGQIIATRTPLATIAFARSAIATLPPSRR